MKVPDVLISGNHKKIKEWQDKESIRRTFERRPDMLDNLALSNEQKKYLGEIEKEKESL